MGLRGEASDLTSLPALSKEQTRAGKEGIPVRKEPEQKERWLGANERSPKHGLVCQSYSFLAGRKAKAKNTKWPGGRKDHLWWPRGGGTGTGIAGSGSAGSGVRSHTACPMENLGLALRSTFPFLPFLYILR